MRPIKERVVAYFCGEPRPVVERLSPSGRLRLNGRLLNATFVWTRAALCIAPAVLVHVAEDTCLLRVGCAKVHVVWAYRHERRWRTGRHWRRRSGDGSEKRILDAACGLAGTCACESAAILIAQAVKVEVAERFWLLLVGLA